MLAELAGTVVCTSAAAPVAAASQLAKSRSRASFFLKLYLRKAVIRVAKLKLSVGSSFFIWWSGAGLTILKTIC